MLSQKQIEQLSARLSELQSRLSETIEQFAIENEKAIDQELEHYLGVQIQSLETSEQITALIKARSDRNLIQLIQGWITTKQADKNHPEFKSVCGISSPRASTAQIAQPLKKDEEYRQRVLKEIQPQYQSIMLQLFDIGQEDFQRNQNAMNIGIRYGVSLQQLPDVTYNVLLDMPDEKITHNQQPEEQKIELIGQQQAKDQQIPMPSKPEEEKQLIGKQEAEDLETLRNLQDKILLERRYKKQANDKESTDNEKRFNEILDKLFTFKKSLYAFNKYKQEPQQSELEVLIKFHENSDAHKLYLQLLNELPLFNSFINNKQSFTIDNFDQVKQALNLQNSLETQLQFIDDYLLSDENKYDLYYDSIKFLKQLTSSKEFLELKNYIDGLMRLQKWQEINQELIKCFLNNDPKQRIKKHASMRYFLELGIDHQGKDQLEDPLTIKQIIASLEQKGAKEHKSDLKYYLSSVSKNFSEGNIEEAMILSSQAIQYQKQLEKIYNDKNLRAYKKHSEVKQRILKSIHQANISQVFRDSDYFRNLIEEINKSFEVSTIIKSYFDLHHMKDYQFKQNNLEDYISIFRIVQEILNLNFSPQQFIEQLIENYGIFEYCKEILDIIFRKPQEQSEFMIEQNDRKEERLKSLFENLNQDDPNFFKIFEKFLQFIPGLPYNQIEIYIQNASFKRKWYNAMTSLEKIILKKEDNKDYQYQINDFMSLPLNYDIDQMMQKISKNFQESQQIEQEELVQLQFQMIKKRLTFENLVYMLYKDFETTDIQITQMNLLCYLLDCCCSELRTMILIACAQYMAVPLIANRPIQNEVIFDDQNFDERNFDAKEQGHIIQYKSKVYEEIGYTYENFQGVLSFKVNNNRNRPLKGSTQIINNIMNRDFETHRSEAPLANYGQVEISFDFNFYETKFIPVADVHGYLEDDQLKCLITQFNIFVIHCFKEDIKIVEQLIQYIKQGSIIFIVQQDDQAKTSQYKKSLLKNHSIYQISEFDLFDRNKQHQQQLYDEIRDKINGHTQQWKQFQQNVDRRLQVLENFAKFCKNYHTLNENKIMFEQQRNDFSRINDNYNFFEKLQEHNLQMKHESLEQKQNPSFKPQQKLSLLINQQDIREGDQQNSLIEKILMIKKFISHIQQFKNELKSQKVLPMNEKYQQICANENIIQRDYSLKQQDIEALRIQNKSYQNELKSKQISQVSQEIHKILNDTDSFVGVAAVIAKLIKSIVDSNLEPKYAQRNQLQDLNSKQKANDNDKKKEYQDKLQSLSIQIQKLQFSIEFLFREFYIKEKIIESTKLYEPPQQINEMSKPYELYMQLAEQQISNGQPFEIIDGDNMKFIHGVYQMMEKDFENEDEIIVISVIGPQSSGKSLLLNTLFGAQFQTSAGRCTKGVYGCLIDIKETNYKSSKYKKMLILDTEGIQSTERTDRGFDQRIVFYILCISHIVLVCNKGEINVQMQEMLKIAVYSISEYKSLVTNMPQVNIVMNMIPKIEENNLDQTYQELAKNLIEMGSQKNDSHLILNIKKENVFMLPNAFSSQGKSEYLLVNKPNFKFAQCVSKLNQKIFQFMVNGNQQIIQYSLRGFFEKAPKIWESINNMHDIDKFQTIDEFELSTTLRQFCNQLIIEEFQNQKPNHIERIEGFVEKVLKNCKYFSKTTSQNVYEKVKEQDLKNFFQEIKQKLFNYFNQKCNSLKFHREIQQMQKEFLERMINTNFIDLENMAKQKIQTHFKQISQQRGNKDLQDKVDEILLIHEQKKINDNEANKLFQDQWNQMILERQQELTNEQKIKEELFEDVYLFYNNQFRRRINSKEYDQIHLNEFIQSNYSDKFLLKSMESEINNHYFLFFTGNSRPPQPERFKERYQKIGKYVEKLEYYQRVRCREIYLWEKVIKIHFDFENLAKSLHQNLYKYYSDFFGLKRIFMFWKNEDEIIESLIIQIQNEGLLFQIQPTQTLHRIMHEIKDRYKFNFSNKMTEFLYDSTKQKIQSLKNEIQWLFEYVKAPQAQQMSENQYIYFQNIRKFTKHRYTVFETIERDKKDFQSINQGHAEISNHPIEKLVANQEILNRFECQEKIHIQTFLDQVQVLDNFNLQEKDIPVQFAKIFFFQKLKKTFIIKEIQRIVLYHVQNLNNDSRNFKDYYQLIDMLRKTEDAEIVKQFVPLNNDLIQRISNDVQKLIQDIDSELEVFCLIVNDQEGKFALHQIAQTLITSIYFYLRKINEYGPLYIFLQTKETERKLFVAKLTSNDKEMDSSLAERAANSVNLRIKEDAQKYAVDYFTQQIEQYDSFFNVQTIINQIEDYETRIAIEFGKKNFQADQNLKQILDYQGDLEECKQLPAYREKVIKYAGLEERGVTWSRIIKMYVKPDEFFTECFDSSWKYYTKDLIQKSQKKYKDYLKQKLITLIEYFKIFLAKVEQKQQISAFKIFEVQNMTEVVTNGQDQHKQISQLSQKALATYLSQMLSLTWDPKLQMVIDGNKMVPPSEDFIFIDHQELQTVKVDKDLRNLIASQLKNEMLSNLKEFFTTLIANFEKEFKNIIDLKEGIITKDIGNKMRQQSTGCNQLCPLCRRKCDQLHKERQEEQYHMSSSSGHQIIGFGGSYHARNNFAMTYGCHELEDQDLVLHQGISKPWQIYKEEFSQKWKFLSNQKGNNEKHKKDNIMVWNLVGPIICKYYQSVEKLQIKFSQADQNAKRMGQIEKIMFIFVLDMSGSMHGIRWSDVTTETKRFLEVIKKDSLMSQYSKFSIITYSDLATTNFQDEQINPDLVDQLVFTGGNTNFNDPLIHVLKICQKYLADFDKFQICFLSDGLGPYPKEAIEAIKENEQVLKKFRITTVAFGDDEGATKGLKPIADAFGNKGSIRTAKLADDFQQVLIEMIPNVYKNKNQ